jgi:hypothetical protein
MYEHCVPVSGECKRDPEIRLPCPGFSPAPRSRMRACCSNGRLDPAALKRPRVSAAPKSWSCSMPWWNTSTGHYRRDPGLSPWYRNAIADFIDGKVSAGWFTHDFQRVFKQEEKLPGPLYTVLQDLWYAVEDFDGSALSEAVLQRSAVVALRRLTEVVSE